VYRSLLATPPGRLVVAGLGLIVLGVVVGFVALWPSEPSAAGGGGLAGTATQTADVERVSRRACPQSQTEACQIVRARLTSGGDQGREITLSLPGTDFGPAFERGDAIRVVANDLFAGQTGIETPPGVEPYSFADFERRSPLYLLAVLFAVVVIALARWKGVRSLIGLALSLVIVTKFIVPAILEGSSPVLVALTGALAVMLVTVGLSHGSGVTSVAAILGAAASLVATALLAVLFVELAAITGFSSEEATLLQGGRTEDTPSLSLDGLILAGIIVGALGVLDDVTISQASTVMAIFRADRTQSLRRLFAGALSVGRDHLSATVNTLVLAYVGAALPLLLLFERASVSFGDALNREAVAAEIVAMLVGSIGLVLAVPLTTALAAWLAQRVPEAALQTADGHAHHH